MARSIFRGGVGAFVGLALILGGCAAKGRAKVQTSSDTTASSDEPSNAWDSTTSAPASAAVSSPPPAAGAADVDGGEPAKPMPGCTLVCNVANKGRIPAADEARMTQGLADVTQALHRCVGGKIPPMTLRFDSTAKLTGFGVDSERESIGLGACIDAVNQRTPAVSYQGPATMRCSERCVPQ